MTERTVKIDEAYPPLAPLYVRPTGGGGGMSSVFSLRNDAGVLINRYEYSLI